MCAAPATFLSAEEILQRQYVAHIIDGSRDPQMDAPKDARTVLGRPRRRKLVGPTNCGTAPRSG